MCQSRSVGVRASAGIGDTCHPRAMRVAELPTPALIVDANALAHNLDTMSAALPGRAPAAARQSAQVHDACPRPGRARPHRVHVCDTERAGGYGARRSRCRPAARQPDRGSRPIAGHGGIRRAGDGRGRFGSDHRRGRRERHSRSARRRQRRYASVRVPAGGSRRDRRSRARTRPHRPRRHGLRRPRGRARRPRRTRGEDRNCHGQARGRPRGGRRRHRLRGRHGNVRHQHGRDRDPGRLLRADGYRIRLARTAVHPCAARGRDRRAREPEVLGRRLRTEGARHGPRQSRPSSRARCGSARTST